MSQIVKLPQDSLWRYFSCFRIVVRVTVFIVKDLIELCHYRAFLRRGLGIIMIFILIMGFMIDKLLYFYRNYVLIEYF